MGLQTTSQTLGHYFKPLVYVLFQLSTLQVNIENITYMSKIYVIMQQRKPHLISLSTFIY